MSEFNLDWQKGYEEGLKVGVENEHNRIIRLLEDDYDRIALQNGYQFLPEQIDWLVELIKGEINE